MRRRPVPPKKATTPAAQRAAETSREESSLGTVATSALHKFKLDQLHPAARILVMTDVSRGEAEFTSGHALRIHWESSKVQRVSHFFNAAPVGWCHCQCPDGSTLFLKFNSVEYQLLDESDLAPAETEIETNDTMSDETKKPTPAQKKKPTPPPKKGVTPKSAPVKKSTTTVAPVAPVAAPAGKKAAAVKVHRLPKTTGNYLWLLRRLQAQAVGQLTNANNRASVRDGMAKVDTFTGTRDFLIKAKVTETEKDFDAFCDVFFSATINR